MHSNLQTAGEGISDRKLTFADPTKIRIMHQRFGSQLMDHKNALEHGIGIGRGGAWLTLNEEQYRS